MVSTEQHSPLYASKAWFIEKHLAPIEHPLKKTAETLLLVSDYACRHIDTLISLLNNDLCCNLFNRNAYFTALESISLATSQPIFMRELRFFRHTHFLRLLLLELSGTAGTIDVMRSWSDCADALILHVLAYCIQEQSIRFGIPNDAKGVPVHLHTLAMGKLGGRELNYSSDVDLIFAYDAVGNTDGSESIDNVQFYSKVIQQFAQILQNTTSEGFVFRVDLRLRPNGDSGALVSSLAALETYYQEQGRDWERYAMVKARIITQEPDASPSWFDRLITPFVYRRYVDFSVIESLRGMKSMIEREVQLNPCLNDIKRGKGGIREVEFIIQNLQLIRGGRMPQLRETNVLSTLAILKKEQLLLHTDVLRQAYLFLRKLENVLQSLNDNQTHTVPEDDLKRAQVQLALGFATWSDFLNTLHQYQRIISHAFHAALKQTNPYEDEKRILMNQLSSLWQGHIEETMAINVLTGMHYKNPTHCYQMLFAFRHSPRCRRLSQSARIRLDHFMVLLLTELMHFEASDTILLEVLHLLENIVGRSAYLALLTENPYVLKDLLYWFANSPFITNLIVGQPFLLEVLLRQKHDWKPLSIRALDQQLTETLSRQPDLELQEEMLRQFKLIHWLMAARAELYGLVSSVRIGKFLSDVAQVILIKVFDMACFQLSLRYPEMIQLRKRFAIIAYGTFGSRDMNYASDLDLVFLYHAKASQEALVTRLTQKILHMLTTRLQSGLLYSVDTRLRPSGAAGLLVSHVDSFVEYQKNHAWTWEHQALLKARIIIGSPAIKRRFLALKQTLFVLPREAVLLKQDILGMRSKMDVHQQADTIKQSRGGLLDLEFLIQFLILNAHYPVAARITHTLSHIQCLVLVHALNKSEAIVLKKAYRHFQKTLHKKILQPNLEDLYDLPLICKRVAEIYDLIFSK